MDSSGSFFKNFSLLVLLEVEWHCIGTLLFVSIQKWIAFNYINLLLPIAFLLYAKRYLLNSILTGCLLGEASYRQTASMRDYGAKTDSLLVATQEVCSKAQRCHQVAEICARDAGKKVFVFFHKLLKKMMT